MRSFFNPDSALWGHLRLGKEMRAQRKSFAVTEAAVSKVVAGDNHCVQKMMMISDTLW